MFNTRSSVTSVWSHLLDNLPVSPFILDYHLTLIPVLVRGMLIAWRKATNLVSDTNSDWKTREIPIIYYSLFSSFCNPPTSSHSLLLITRSTIKCCLITVSTTIKTQIKIFVRTDFFN